MKPVTSTSWRTEEWNDLHGVTSDLADECTSTARDWYRASQAVWLQAAGVVRSI
jgi:hypothetical protein